MIVDESSFADRVECWTVFGEEGISANCFIKWQSGIGNQEDDGDHNDECHQDRHCHAAREGRLTSEHLGTRRGIGCAADRSVVSVRTVIVTLIDESIEAVFCFVGVCVGMMVFLIDLMMIFLIVKSEVVLIVMRKRCVGIVVFEVKGSTFLLGAGAVFILKMSFVCCDIWFVRES